MSLSITLYDTEENEVFRQNVTHNLNRMADAAGIYKAIWRPDEIGIQTAGELIPILSKGIEELKSDPEKFRELEPANKWGTYETFVPWVERYLAACEENPDATIYASR